MDIIEAAKLRAIELMHAPIHRIRISKITLKRTAPFARFKDVHQNITENCEQKPAVFAWYGHSTYLRLR